MRRLPDAWQKPGASEPPERRDLLPSGESVARLLNLPQLRRRQRSGRRREVARGQLGIHLFQCPFPALLFGEFGGLSGAVGLLNNQASGIASPRVLQVRGVLPRAP